MKSFIFDMDGVIADTEPLHEKVWSEFFDSKGIEVTEKDLLSMKGKSGVAVVKMFMPTSITNEEAQILRNERAGMFLEEINKGVTEVKGFSSFFNKLKEQNIKIAVATSAERARAEIILTQINVLDKVDVIVTAEDVVNGKPNPEIFLKAAEIINAQPKNCFVFEDSTSGIQAAQRADMIPVLIMTSHKKGDFDNVDLAYNNFDEITLEELLSYK